jgi:murein L,D-transpeptidase YafK
MKNLVIFFFAVIISQNASPQTSDNHGGPNPNSFINFQRSFARPSEALQRKQDTLQKQFEQKKLKWPAKYIYIRSFKYDSYLEVWVKDKISDPFQLFKTYKICALAGTLGPKRMEGDFQVPEGFYYISEFNPNSSYYLSLGLNYPNMSDRILSDSLRPGGDIYIHGSCVTVGCIPITDEQIDELYILAAYAKDAGQDYIPVHIFPIRYDKERSIKYLETLTKDDGQLKKFADRLEDAYNYFELHHQLPVIMVNPDGEYRVYNAPDKKIKLKPEEKVVVKRIAVPHRSRNVGLLVQSVTQWPQFPGGNDAFTRYLEQIGKEMASFLPKDMKKAYVQVEFIVDKDGVPVNIKVLHGVNNEDFNDELIDRMEKMGTWQPAMLNDQPVAKKIIQTITVEER